VSFQLTREVLAAGLCADLGNSDADAREFKRRAREVLRLLSAAGVTAAFEEAQD
jgi:adenylylsulfate kinase-like enzyme